MRILALLVFLFLMIRRPPRSTPLYSSAASDVYKRQVADLGGGSLELARVENGLITNKTSLPLGVLRLLNNPILKKRNLSKYIKQLLREEKWLSKKKFQNLYLVGGTWRALFKLHLFQNKHPVHIIHQYSVNYETISSFVEKIASFNKAKLKTVEYISKSRTPYLPYLSLIHI